MSTKLMRMRNLAGWASLGAVVMATASCGDVVRGSRSPVMLVVNSLQATKGNVTSLGTFLLSDVITNGTVFNDVGAASLGVVMKDTTIAPTTNSQVTVSRYHVAFHRADGRNTPGVDVPYEFDGAVTITIPAGAAQVVNFELVRHSAKQESPLVQLVSNAFVINTIADVTFYGQDQVGNDLSVTGQILVNFGNFAD